MVRRVRHLLGKEFFQENAAPTIDKLFQSSDAKPEKFYLVVPRITIMLCLLDISHRCIQNVRFPSFGWRLHTLLVLAVGLLGIFFDMPG